METENPPPEQPEFDLDKIELEPPEPEDYPEDLILALYEFMDDICKMEAHIDAASACLYVVRARLGDKQECELEQLRAYHLLESIRWTAKSAARRVLEVFPQVVEYCEEHKIKRPDPKDEDE